MSLRTCLGAALAVAAVSWSSIGAAAPGDQRDWTDNGPNVMTWGFATAELYMALAMPLVATQKTKAATTVGAVTGLTGAGATVMVSYLAQRGRADTRFPQAIHGALWTGAEFLALGAFAEQRIGPTAVALGATGALVGGLVGTFVVRSDRGRWFWLVGAPAGFGVGGAIVLVEAFAPGSGAAPAKTADRILFGTISGFALTGLATGYVGAIASGRVHASLSVGASGVGFSGTF